MLVQQAVLQSRVVADCLQSVAWPDQRADIASVWLCVQLLLVVY
jgi:hypothetical protein